MLLLCLPYNTHVPGPRSFAQVLASPQGVVMRLVVRGKVACLLPICLLTSRFQTLPLASPCGERRSSLWCKSSPASTQPLLHQDSCPASSWPCTVTGALRLQANVAGDLGAAVVPRGWCAGPQCGHALASANHCPAALWVSPGGQKARGAHPERKAT